MRTYWFGVNWRNFIRFHINERSLKFAEDNLRQLIAPISLQGLDFLDIGCGSGIHSLAALKLGAASVTSFDVDQDSVQASLAVRNKFGEQYKNKWKIRQLSILENTEIECLDKYDLVYAWGSLHHSGDVWTAIRNSTIPVKKGGYLVLALYSKDVVPFPSHEFWLEKKRAYVSSGIIKRRLYEAWYIWTFYFNKNFFNLMVVLERFRNYKQERGMSLLVDLRDWLGGWPMEFVGDQDVIAFLEKDGFIAVKVVRGKANTEFMFTREA